jgi:hypothetical protein
MVIKGEYTRGRPDPPGSRPLRFASRTLHSKPWSTISPGARPQQSEDRKPHCTAPCMFVKCAELGGGLA